MKRTAPPAAAAAAIFAAMAMSNPAFAESAPAVLTYENFELAVPHVDLASCPAEFEDGNHFCRATVSHAEMHVFIFSYDGDMPFVGMRTYPATGLDSLYD